MRVLVAAELTLAGVPAVKVPDHWPDCDVRQQFDRLAIALLCCGEPKPRRFFIVRRDVADRSARRYDPKSKAANLREWRIDEVAQELSDFEDDVTLREAGATA